jgi:hypothetical protein
MSARLRLDLRRFTVDGKDRWDWRLWAGSRIVSGSRQTYSRRIDCARGAEVGAGLAYVVESVTETGGLQTPCALRGTERVPVRTVDERTAR